MKQHLSTLLLGFVALAAMPGTFIIASTIMSIVEIFDIRFFIMFAVALLSTSYTLGYVIKRIKG